MMMPRMMMMIPEMSVGMKAIIRPNMSRIFSRPRAELANRITTSIISQNTSRPTALTGSSRPRLTASAKPPAATIRLNSRRWRVLSVKRSNCLAMTEPVSRITRAPIRPGRTSASSPAPSSSRSQRSFILCHLDDDFAQLFGALQPLKGAPGFRQWNHGINLRPQASPRSLLGHRTVFLVASHCRTQNAPLIPEQLSHIGYAHGTSRGPAGDETSLPGQAAQRFLPGLFPDIVHHDFDAAFRSQRPDLFRHVGRRMVQHHVCAELAGAFKLGVRGTGDDDRGVEELGDLKGCNSDPTANSPDQYRLPGAKRRSGGEHAPGRKRRERKGSRLGDRHLGGNWRQIALRDDDELGQRAVAVLSQNTI